MARRKSFLKMLVVIAALAAAGTPLSRSEEKAAAAPNSRRENSRLARMRRRILGARPLAMYYSMSDKRGMESLERHARRMTVVAPQCYWVEGDGVVAGSLPPRLKEISSRARLPVMPLVFNRGFNRETVTALLHHPEAQRRAVTYLAFHARRENLAGFQIDIENIDPADQQLFTAFVKAAADRMHQEGRLLSVALVPKFSDQFPRPDLPDHPTMGEWAAAYDYRALGEIADFVTLMTYDHFNRSTPAGPIAGYDWVKKALAYAEERIPPDKLLLGIPLYGREWTEAGEYVRSRSLTAAMVHELRGEWRTSSRWDDEWRSPWFQVQRGRTTHTVWYENSRSWTEKLNLVRDDHLRGFAAWRLGFEGPEFWSLEAIEARKTPRRGSPHGARPAGSGSAVARQGTAVDGAPATSQ
jgi:spore germination protein YaaH